LAGIKRTAAVWLLVLGAAAGVTPWLVTESSGAHLQLAPVFVGVALAVATVWKFRSRSRRGRG
jgi:membrane protein implicated in regulation of membrane protease activity